MKLKHAIFITIATLLLSACRTDGTDIEGKWQLQRIETQTGVIKCDSLFFNFMDGVFTAICVGTHGEYADMYGRYTYKDAALTVYGVRWEFNHYDWDIPQELSSARLMMWEDGKRIFTTHNTKQQMRLTSGDSTYIFRKY